MNYMKLSSNLKVPQSISSVKGLRSSTQKKFTCLRPDWWDRLFLALETLKLSKTTPNCWPEGWRISLADSRFLSPLEQRYAAIEGETLTVT